MTPERWRKIDWLFHAALEHEPARRPGFLAQECADDEPLGREVAKLLASHEQAAAFIETPASDVAAALLADDQPGLLAGQMVGHFRIAGVLAAGGMGEVYLADDTRLGRKVALKLLPPIFTVNADRVRRFGQEARAASALNHPSIVTVYDIGQADSLHYIAAEFIEGETLRAHMTSTRMTVGEVLDVAAQVASALQAAHEAGIVHRDVKPENVMLRRDQIVKVLDFGLAKLAPHREAFDPQAPTEPTVKTNPGVVMGTTAYMSPEQARGAEVDARTDVWSLGVVLYEMVAGGAPFEGETPSHVIVKILESEPPPLAHDGEVLTELERIIFKALRKNRAERYQTAGDMALDLKGLKEELTVESRLKQFRSSGGNGRETATVSDGRVALKTAHASAGSTADVAIKYLTSSGAYLVNGIKRHKGGAIFTSVTAFLLIASFLFFSNSTKGGSEALDSVAVLPFVNQSGDPETEYLADGINDGVINRLSRLHKLRVISLSTVLRYKGKEIDPQAVGRELNVRSVLVGRVTQRGDMLAISTELVDVRDNRRLWGAQYNGKLSDVFAIEHKVAREIAENLRLRLDSTELQRLTKQYTESPDAYSAYLKGRYLLNKRTAQMTRKSIEYFERAIRLDPNYALAYATLAEAHMSVAKLGGEHLPEEVMPQAKAAVAKALAIDDTLAEAHAALGSLRFYEWDWPGAEREFKQAIELNPNYERNNADYEHYLLVMKRFDEALAESKQVLERDPVSVHYNRNVGMLLYFTRRYDEAIEQCQKTLELDPNMVTVYVWLAAAYEQKKLFDQSIEAQLRFREVGGGDFEEVKSLRETYAALGWEGYWHKVIDMAKNQTEQRQGNPIRLAEIHARLANKDQAFAYLEKAYEQRRTRMKFLNTDPIWDGLRSDPRYADLVRRMGLEP